MKSLVTLLILTFIASTSFGQSKYEKGYFIGNDDQKTECFIKSVDWNFNPDEITYKLTESGKPKKGDLNSIKEFGIDSVCKFVKAEVRIDRSTKLTPGAKNGLAPVWAVEKLFLKVVLEGKANLYCYSDRKITRFFYSLTDATITPLIYKEVNNGLTIIKNTDFRQQLWDKVRIPKSTMEFVKNVDYNANELSEYFETFNKVTNEKSM